MIRCRAARGYVKGSMGGDGELASFCVFPFLFVGRFFNLSIRLFCYRMYAAGVGKVVWPNVSSQQPGQFFFCIPLLCARLLARVISRLCVLRLDSVIMADFLAGSRAPFFVVTSAKNSRNKRVFVFSSKSSKVRGFERILGVLLVISPRCG